MILIALFVLFGSIVGLVRNYIVLGIEQFELVTGIHISPFIRIVGAGLILLFTFFAYKKFNSIILSAIYIIISLALSLRVGFEGAWVVTYGFLLFIAFYLAATVTRKGFVESMILSVLIVAVLGMVYGILVWGGALARQIGELVPGEEKPPGPTVPETELTGKFEMLDVLWGTEYTNYEIPTVYKNESYILPITIENKNPYPVENITVSGYITAENTTLVLVPNACTESSPCRIGANGQLSINLQTENVPFESRTVKIVVVVAYPHRTFGRGDFFIFRSDKDLREVSSPQQEDDPLDLTVFFWPNHYVAQSVLTQPNQTTLYVVMKNLKYKYGDIIVRNVNITRLAELENFTFIECYRGQIKTVNESFTNLNILLTRKETTLNCKYSIANLTIRESYIAIPTYVVVEYTFRHHLESIQKLEQR